MKIKTKLTLGVGLLFLLIILLGSVGAVYINALKADTENILAANYNSLQFSRKMLVALDENDQASLDEFEQNLLKQEKNITETGEKKATEANRDYFRKYKSNPQDEFLKLKIRKEIFRIMDMNMGAIQKKSELARSTAETATFWIAVTATLCFLIAFVLLINLPSNIANPIRELTNSIKQLAAGNYSQRVHFESHNEFGVLAKSFNSMAQKLEEYNNSNLARLMMEKKRIETLVSNMHDPVIGLDENLHVIFVNEEALKTIGLKQSEMIGVSARELAAHNNLMDSLIQDLMEENTLSKEKNLPIKIYANNKESYFEKETVHMNIIPTGEESKQLIGHMIILRNVTDYKELDVAKTNFIATVSHEFKTPISAIKMSLHLLENDKIGKLNPEQQHLLESISDDADRLLKITGELLNMAQVESGHIQLSVFPAEPQEILMYAVNANKTQAAQKQMRFEISCEENVPHVLADKDKTAWVLMNLISNAIRYSYDDTTIELKVSEEDDHIKFTVKDTGQGIAPEYREKIFDRYFRVPGIKKEGTGLGLAISKEFIEAQGGTITVDSELGVGSTFSVCLKSVG